MPKEEPKFAELVKRASTSVVEALQAGGHAEMIDTNTAEPIDWIRILHEEVGDLLLEARYDLSDATTNKAVRIRLARLAAFCEAWDKQLA